MLPPVVEGWQPAQESLNLNIFFTYIGHVSYQIQEFLHILIHGHVPQPEVEELLHLPLIVML